MVFLFLCSALAWLDLRLFSCQTGIDPDLCEWAFIVPLFFLAILLLAWLELFWILLDYGIEVGFGDYVSAIKNGRPIGDEDDKLRRLNELYREKDPEDTKPDFKRVMRHRPTSWRHYASLGYSRLVEPDKGHVRRTALIAAFAVCSVVGYNLFYYTEWPLLPAMFPAILLWLAFRRVLVRWLLGTKGAREMVEMS